MQNVRYLRYTHLELRCNSFYSCLLSMPTEITLMLGVLAFVVLFSLLRIEKLIKISFWSYVLLGLLIWLGISILQWATQLQLTPDEKILGITYWWFAEFLINAQPTILLVLFALWLRFFMQNSHLTIHISWELFEKKMQTLLRCFLSLGSIVSSLYFILAYFKGAIYEWVFMQPFIITYTPWIPVIGMITALLCLLASSKINLRFSIKTESSSLV